MKKNISSTRHFSAKSFILFCLAVLVFSVFCGSVRQTALARSESESAKFSFREKDANTFELKEGETPLLEYVYRERTVKSPWPDYQFFFSSGGFIHPLYGLNGEILTEDMPEKWHLHHHGICSGFMTVEVKEKDGSVSVFNTWEDRPGMKKCFVSWGECAAKDDSFTFTANHGWFRTREKEGSVVPEMLEKCLDEQTVVTVSRIIENEPAFGRCRFLDFDISLTPTKYEMKLAGSPRDRKGFSALAIRFQQLKDGMRPMIYSENGLLKQDDTLYPAQWINYVYPFAGKEKPASGVAILPSAETRSQGWVIRHYGVISTGWPGLEGIVLKPGETARLKYRIVIHEKVPVNLP